MNMAWCETDRALRQGYIGNPQQLWTLRKCELMEGPAKGSCVIEVSTASGLQIDVLPDCGLDIGQVRYCGVNMTFISKNGYDSPDRIIPYENEFAHTFPGGLLYTCGLRNVGAGNRDGGEWHPVHGRYHGLRADHVSTDVEGKEIVIRGTIRETALFDYVLEVKRCIRIGIETAEISVEDTVTNQTPRDEEYMHIYHCNFGYPMLSEQTELLLPEERITVPRTEFAKTGMGKELTFEPPVDGEEERVFFHHVKETRAILRNPALGAEMTLTWSGDTLPILAQWRCMASGVYVLGLEPTNCYIMGREEERKNGTLQKIKAFETVKNKVDFRFSEI